MVGHSMGGDISMYFAKEYPEQIKKVVTLDNLRVPFMTEGKFKILSFRSKDTQFKPDPGVVPDAEQCEKSDITVVDTDMRHNDMRDTGPDKAKTAIQTMLDKFLSDTDSAALAPVDTKSPKIIEKGSVSALSPAQKSPQRAVTN
jgi:pimeloyl-ACP methyl ester carboxylesterase